MTAKEIVDFVQSWLDAGQLKRSQIVSEAALTGKFGHVGHFTEADVEDLYQRLVSLGDKIDAVLALKYLIHKMTAEGEFFFDDAHTLADAIIAAHDHALAKVVIDTLMPRTLTTLEEKEAYHKPFEEKWKEITSLMGWL